jgi:hypothetical protein
VGAQSTCWLLFHQTRALPLHCGRLPNGSSSSLLLLVVGSRVRHDAPGALRGLFFLVGMLLALRGLFLLVDMSLPVVHSAVTSPFLPSSCWVHCPCLLLCFLYGSVAVSRSVGTLASLHCRQLTDTNSLALLFLLSRSVQSVPSSWSAYCDLIANPCPVLLL